MNSRWFAAVGLLALGGAVGWYGAQSQQRAEPPKEVAPAEKETPLDAIDWLVGDWVDTRDDLSIDISCHFTKNKAFLIRSFRIVTAKNVRMSGMQVIAWDPAKQTIRSWTYDSDGGFGEEYWTQVGNRYTIRAKYTLPDGGTGSSMQILTYVNDDMCLWQSINREIDGELHPDTDEITLVRKVAADDEPKGGK